MKYSLFGDPRPTTFEEVKEVLDDKGIDPDSVEAVISHDPYVEMAAYDLNMTGYTAEVTDLETGDEICTVTGRPDKESLEADLKAAGIVYRYDE